MQHRIVTHVADPVPANFNILSQVSGEVGFGHPPRGPGQLDTICVILPETEIYVS